LAQANKTSDSKNKKKNKKEEEEEEEEAMKMKEKKKRQIYLFWYKMNVAFGKIKTKHEIKRERLKERKEEKNKLIKYLIIKCKHACLCSCVHFYPTVESKGLK